MDQYNVINIVVRLDYDVADEMSALNRANELNDWLSLRPNIIRPKTAWLCLTALVSQRKLSDNQITI